MAIPFDSAADKREPAPALLSMLLGGWLLASGSLLGTGPTINTCAVGVACIVVSAIATTTPAARHVLTLLATWLVVSTCAFSDAGAVAIANNVVASIAIVFVATPRSARRSR